jgi:hypothetical protein
MLSGSAASAPAQLQRDACTLTHNGARSQLFQVARCGCSCSHVLTGRYIGGAVVSWPARRQTCQRRQRTRSSRAACTTLSSSHSDLGCLRSAGSAATSRTSSCSSVSSGLAHPPACRPQPGRCHTELLSPRRSVCAHASLDATVQDVLMGSSVAIAIGMALYYGSKVMHAAFEGCEVHRCQGVGPQKVASSEPFCRWLHQCICTSVPLLLGLQPLTSVRRGSRRCARGAAGLAACAALRATALVPWRRRMTRRICHPHSSARWARVKIRAFFSDCPASSHQGLAAHVRPAERAGRGPLGRHAPVNLGCRGPWAAHCGPGHCGVGSAGPAVAAAYWCASAATAPATASACEGH